MVGVGRAHHPLLKVIKIAELHRHIKVPLCDLRPIAAQQGLIQRLLRGGSDNAFVIEMANNRVERACVYRL
jgi:hypothetical protein